MMTHLLATPDDQGQNKIDLTNSVLMCERFNMLDKAGAAGANGIHKNYGVIDRSRTASVIDRMKLRQGKPKYRER